MRRAVCSTLPADKQREVLRAEGRTIVDVGGNVGRAHENDPDGGPINEQLAAKLGGEAHLLLIGASVAVALVWAWSIIRRRSETHDAL